ncbi:hypothetical protein PRZ48_003294 [Zasmidium cellare]|uniref:Uncharacterized protein n=1 Tax=Zasmidium cellare TaxID=395010 RepID=A0ABR0EVX0_ZASCE|nr:hypothetical protein PRZ48_003294 [Zasmidium cellare]
MSTNGKSIHITTAAVQRTIQPPTLTHLETLYTTSETTAPPHDRLPTTAEQLIYRQEQALKARKHMIPHVGDGLQIAPDYDSGSNKIATHILIESLPVIWHGTPYGHLDGLKKCVMFVAIATKEFKVRTLDPSARLPKLETAEGEVFWVSGRCEILNAEGDPVQCFVAKSQDKLMDGGGGKEGRKWEESRWGLVEMDSCDLAMLDVKDGAWVLCAANVLGR